MKENEKALMILKERRLVGTTAGLTQKAVSLVDGSGGF